MSPTSPSPTVQSAIHNRGLLNMDRHPLRECWRANTLAIMPIHRELKPASESVAKVICSFFKDIYFGAVLSTLLWGRGNCAVPPAAYFNKVCYVASRHVSRNQLHYHANDYERPRHDHTRLTRHRNAEDSERRLQTQDARIHRRKLATEKRLACSHSRKPREAVRIRGRPA